MTGAQGEPGSGSSRGFAPGSRHRRGQTPRTVVAGLAGLGLVAVLLAAGACSVLEQAGVQRPSVALDSTRLQSISLQNADLLLGFRVDNPNTFGIHLDGFDYRLAVAGQQLAQGDRREGLSIDAAGRSRIDLPIAVGWDDLAAIYRSLRGGGNTGYRIDAGFTFDVPVLGPVRIPVSREGDFPIIHLPKVSLSSLDLRGLTAGGADLSLALELENPNDFPLTVGGLDYTLDLAGSRVLSTRDARSLAVAQGRTERWEIPLHVDFAQAGRAIQQALTSGGRLDYRLTGNLDLSAPSPWIEDTRFPLDTSGRVNLR